MQLEMEKDKKQDKTEDLTAIENEFSKTLEGLIKEFHPVLQRAIEFGSKRTVVNSFGFKATRFIYPYACFVGCCAAKFTLDRIYGKRITVDIAEFHHPRMKELSIERHFALIVTDNLSGKKYFLSFFEGLFNEDFKSKRVEKVKFLEYSYDDEEDICNTLKYTKWYKKQNFPPVFFEFENFKKVTDLTGLVIIALFEEDDLTDLNPNDLEIRYMLKKFGILDKLELDKWNGTFKDQRLKQKLIKNQLRGTPP